MCDMIHILHYIYILLSIEAYNRVSRPTAAYVLKRCATIFSSFSEKIFHKFISKQPDSSSQFCCLAIC